MTDLLAIERLYKCAASCEVYRHRVHHESFATFCVGLQRFQHDLGEASEDGYWQPILRYLCRFRFRASATPIPFNDPSIFSPSVCANIEALLSRGRYVYPDLAARALELTKLHQEIAAVPANPLLDAILDRLTEKTAVLVKEVALITPTERVFGSSLSVRVLAPINMQGLICADHLIVVGPPRWYPHYVFSAPRSPRIDLLRYSWMRNGRVDYPGFVCDQSQSKRKSHFLCEEDVAATIDPEAILPSLNWQHIVQTARAFAENGLDEVDARLFVLDGGNAVFLEADEEATARVINPRSDEQPVRRVPVTELTAGTYVLLRTSGGGDYVRPLADRFLGSQAKKARDLQQSWKMRLRQKVRDESALEVAIRLLDLGSRIANETNVRNWMSERSIKTAAYEDFVAIMQLIGEAPRAKECWDTMTIIDRAHRKAGFSISKLLLKQVKAANLQEIAQRGRLDFTLPDVEGGSITAFRIDQIAPDIYRIPVTRLGHIIQTNN